MTTEAEAIASLARAASASEVIADADRTFLVTPVGSHVLEITDPQDKSDPRRIIQGVTLQTVDSLVDYVDRFSSDRSVLFADIDHNSIAGLIDYHSAAGEAGAITAAHVAHRATLTLPFSAEWKTWTEACGRLKGQLEFARFIEENAADVEAPSGADLLESVRDLQAVRKVNFTKAVRTATDNESFTYSDETNVTKGGVEVPTKFQLRIPVYFGEPATEVYAFLRWQLNDGELKLGIVLHRAEHVRQAVFKGIVQDVAARTERPAMFGKA